MDRGMVLCLCFQEASLHEEIVTGNIISMRATTLFETDFDMMMINN
jgi:hypothetical protein